MDTSTSHPKTFLQSFEAMAVEAPEEGLSLQAIFERLDERAFGAGLFVLALPCAIPLLWGIPQIVALPMLALSLQMLAGRHEPWLPERFGVRMIEKRGLKRMSRFGRRWFGWLEVLAHPRLTFLAGKGAERLVALFLVVFCASILLPIPGTNSVPGVAVAIVAFGLMSRDGLLVLFGLLLGSAWISLLVFGGSQLIAYLRALI